MQCSRCTKEAVAVIKTVIESPKGIILGRIRVGFCENHFYEFVGENPHALIVDLNGNYKKDFNVCPEEP